MPVWTLPSSALDAATVRVVPHLDGRRVPLDLLFAALATDPSLADALTKTLAAAPFAAFCLEFPPLTDVPRDAELVLVDSPALARSRPDPSPFDAIFAARRAPVHRFPNLGGDAILVSPDPRHFATATHLAELVREAPPTLTRALWAEVGAAVSDELADGHTPIWVSTAGLGVAWLHVRLGRAPKYYRHRPYTRA
jgi:hypothetical protein